MRSLVVLAVAGLILMPGFSLGSPRLITIWNYHDFPPFSTNETSRTDLSSELTKWLTEASEGRYEFRLERVPLSRLDRILDNGKSGVVLWVSPEWFNDTERTRFLWTPPILQDQEIVVTRVDSGLEYEGPRSLEGKTIATVHGYRYPDLSARSGQGGTERIDVPRESNALRVLAHKRPIDATIMSELAARYIAKRQGLSDQLRFESPPLSRYDRHLMITPDLPDVARFLKQALSRLHGSDKWCEMQRTYGIPRHHSRTNACGELR